MKSAATHPLQPHPATPCAAVDAVGVTVAFDPAGRLRLTYVLAGDLSRLRLPAAAAQPGPADGLWRHTCFEAFVGSDHAPDYREFNFAPSGHWAAYAFSAERVPAKLLPPLRSGGGLGWRPAAPKQAQAPLDASPPPSQPSPARGGRGKNHSAAPHLTCRRDTHTLTLEALLPLPPSSGPLRLGLSAVIETTDGALSYWALAHPAPRPDFHQRAGWTLRLER